MAVGHHHRDVVTLVVEEELDRRTHSRAVAPEVRIAPLVAREGRAGQEVGHGDPAASSRKEAHRREDGEPPPYPLGDGQGPQPLFPGDLPQGSFLGVRGDNQMVPVPASQGPLQQVPHDEELRHGLRRDARLGDDVETGLLREEERQEVSHPVGVNVIQDEEPRTPAQFPREEVVERAVEGALQGDVAQGRPADAQHHQVVKPGTRFLSKGEEVREPGVVVG